MALTGRFRRGRKPVLFIGSGSHLSSVPNASRFRRVLVGVLGVLLLLASDGKAEIPYELEIQGPKESIISLLEGEASLTLEKENPPKTLGGVRRRAEADEDLFIRLLRSRGYYTPKVRWSLEPQRSGDDETAIVRFRIEPGSLYRVDRIEISGLPPEGSFLMEAEGLKKIGLKHNRSASASPILAAEKKLVTELVAVGYPFAAIAGSDFTVEHTTAKMTVAIDVDPGPRARFGAVHVHGVAKVEEKYVRRRLTFEHGAWYDPEAVEASRTKLIEPGIFSSVSITHAEELDEDGTLPMHVTVAENKARTVGTGVLYSSIQGVGLRAFWEHRNLLGGAEKMRVEAEGNQLGFRGVVSFREPDFWREDQNLLLELVASAADTDAFRSDSLRASAGIDRKLGEHLTGGLGVSFEQTTITGGTQDEDFTLVGLPGFLSFDTTNDPLDATRGHRLALYATPYVDPLDTATSFFSLLLSERFYQKLGASDRYVFAGRFSLGSIQGATGNSVPLTKRFYAGGADSLRGYDFQFVGPLDDENNPTGGFSLVQFGAELRWKITDTVGVVPFVEAANVYQDAIPDFGGDLFWGAGLGLRYYTAVGPLRVDVGIPLNPRDGIEDTFELYISLGQAF